MAKTRYPGVRMRGNRVEIDIRYKGTRLRKCLPLDPANRKQLQLAMNMRSAMHIDIALGKFDPAHHFPDSEMATFRFGGKKATHQTIAKAMEEWLKSREGEVRSRTYKTLKQRTNLHVIPGLGEILLSDLTPKQIRKWIKNIPLSNKTKNEILSPLRQMLTGAYEDEEIDKNPMDRVKSFPVGKKAPDPFLFNELEVIERHTPEELKPLIKFWAWTGPRSGEIFAIPWSEVNFTGASVMIQYTLSTEDDDDDGNEEENIKAGVEERTKTQASRRKITLFQPALDALDEQRKLTGNQEYVFINPKTGTLWDSATFGKIWREILKSAGIRHRRAYNLRHTYASIMLSAGETLGWLRQQMGHSSLRMLEERYAAYMEDADTTAGTRVRALIKKKDAEDSEGDD